MWLYTKYKLISLQCLLFNKNLCLRYVENKNSFATNNLKTYNYMLKSKNSGKFQESYLPVLEHLLTIFNIICFLHKKTVTFFKIRVNFWCFLTL